MYRQYFLVLVLIQCMSTNQVYGWTEKQLTAAVKLIRNMCQPKTKATNDDIEKMHKGDWNIDRTAMCYMSCALSSYKLMSKENRLDYDSAVSQLKNLPERFKESTLECINMCRDSVTTPEDACVAGYEVAKCVYFCNPEYYFLP